MQEARHILETHMVVRWLRIPCDEQLIRAFLLTLSTEDQDRARRFRRKEDCHRFLWGRWMLRDLLRRHVSTESAALPLGFTENRRPYLTGSPEIDFSISHAEEIVVVALARNGRIGVDVELVSRRVDLDGVAERILNEQDLVTFRHLSAENAREGFFRAWTGKEAFLKATGLGLSGGLQEISVPFSPATTPYTLAPGARSADGSFWNLKTIPVPESYVAAVVWDDPAKKIDLAEIVPDRFPAPAHDQMAR